MFHNILRLNVRASFTECPAIHITLLTCGGQVARDAGYEVVEERIPYTALWDADEAFTVGTAVVVITNLHYYYYYFCYFCYYCYYYYYYFSTIVARSNRVGRGRGLHRAHRCRGRVGT